MDPLSAALDDLDCSRQYASIRLRSLEHQGLAVAELGKGGQFRWTPTTAGEALLHALPEPPFEDVGGPLSRVKRDAFATTPQRPLKDDRCEPGVPTAETASSRPPAGHRTQTRLRSFCRTTCGRGPLLIGSGAWGTHSPKPRPDASGPVARQG
jgi:hypothetical protein